MRESRVSTNKQPAKVPAPGEQAPVMTVYGNPPQLIRLESDQLMHLATALIEKLGQCWVVTPTRCVLATRTETPPVLQMPVVPPPVVPPPQANGQAVAAAGTCNRCHGEGRTARGDICPVCNGKRVVVP